MNTKIIKIEIQPNDRTRYEIDVILGYGVVYKNYLIDRNFWNDNNEINNVSFIVCRAVDAYYNIKSTKEQFDVWCQRHKDIYINSTLKSEIEH